MIETSKGGVVLRLLRETSERRERVLTLRDQVAVVTGASSGIGKAIALGLAAEGAQLALLGRREDALAQVGQAALAAGAVAHAFAVDLTLDAEIERTAEAVTRRFRDVDVLVHAAAVNTLGRLEDASVADLDRQFATNVRAPYALTRALLPMLRARRGQIVFINSWAGLIARAGSGQYAATKHALKAIADSLREEVNSEGLRVLSVFPGRTATPMQEAIHAIEGKEYHPERLQQPEDVAAVVVNALRLPRTTEVTEIRMRPLIRP